MTIKQSFLAVSAIVFVFTCGTDFVNAQQSPAEQSPSTTAAREDRDDNETDLGWIGLLGLAGLAGLLGRRREYGRDSARTNVRTP